MYVIYHVVGIKVGCTKNFERRRIQNESRYSDAIEIKVLEEIPLEAGDKVAGDKEWQWSDRFGYPRANHYTQRWDTRLTSKELSENGKLGAKAAGLGNWNKKFRQESSIGFENNPNYNKSEQHKIDAAKGAAIAAANQTTGFQTGAAGRASGKKIHICPHCGLTGKGPTMGRWHFDNCKSRNVSV